MPVTKQLLRKAPQILTVTKTVGVPTVPFFGKIVDVLVIMPLMQLQAPQIQTVAQTLHIDMSRSASRSSHRPSMRRGQCRRLRKRHREFISDRILEQSVDEPVPQILEAAAEAIDAPVSRIQDDFDEVVRQLIPPRAKDTIGYYEAWFLISALPDSAEMRKRTSSSRCG